MLGNWKQIIHPLYLSFFPITLKAHKMRVLRVFKFVPLFFVCLFLFGCAAGAKMENMTYQGGQKRI